ncbi:sensory transduction protein kinase [Desmospora sp. 8437]|nr:sensory transduction protein kinase [Desmospora sp. 8437]
MLYLLIAVVLLLLISHLRLLREMKRLEKVLEEVCAGNLSRRFRLYTFQPHLRTLVTRLNTLLDQFQDTLKGKREAEERRKEMLSHLSHDFRTPITALLGYLHMLEEQLELEGKKASYLKTVLKKADKLSTLSRDYFQLAKIESRDAAPEMTEFDLVNLIQEVILSFYYQIKEKEIQPVLRLPTSPFIVYADRNHTERILANLISNVLIYGASGKVLGIEVREGDHNVWVDIWDDGKGIPADEIPNLFDRLYRGKTTSQHNPEGNGLGLAISKKLVEQQGGSITVHSIPNQKTTFSFSLRSAVNR